MEVKDATAEQGARFLNDYCSGCSNTEKCIPNSWITFFEAMPDSSGKMLYAHPYLEMVFSSDSQKIGCSNYLP